MKQIIWIALFFTSYTAPLQTQVISKSFELRYFTDSTHAAGINGFNGDSTIFTPEQRVEFLQQYAQFAKQYYDNPDLTNLPILTEEVKLLTNTIKPIPKPLSRKRIELDEWKWTTNQKGQKTAQEKAIATWTEAAEVQIINNELFALREFQYAKEFDELQDWRFTLQWNARIPKTQERSAFLLLDKESNPVVLIGITTDGGCFYKSRLGLPIGVGQFTSDTLVNFKLFVDVEAGRFSLYVNDELAADFVRTLSESPIQRFFIQIPTGASIDDLYGITYKRPSIQPEKAQYPLPVGNVFINQDFEVRAELGDIGLSTLNDSSWQSLRLPINSGDRFRKEDLVLRNTFSTRDSYDQATLELRHVAPLTEVWLNGQIIHVQAAAKNAVSLNISDQLRKNGNNTLMLRLKTNPKGWYLNKVWIDLTASTYVESAHAYTTDLSGALKVQAKLKTTDLQSSANGLWQGRVNVRVFPFMPSESNNPVVNRTFPITMRLFQPTTFEETLTISNPKFWSTDAPNLYKVVVSIIDNQGRFLDDVVLTTGLRTVSQEDGIFKINGQPTLLKGANLADYVPFSVAASDAPINPSEAWLVRIIQSAKSMGANVLRVQDFENIDNEQLAFLCDYFGMMLIHQTANSESNPQPWANDIEQIQTQVSELRHHSSIIIWQAPDNLRFYNYIQDAKTWMTAYYESIVAIDSTRLVSLTGLNPDFGSTGIPNAYGTRLYDSKMGSYRLLSDTTVWTAPKVVRGNTDYSLSLGKDWDDFRRSPISTKYDTVILNYLNDSARVYIDFNSEAIAGQENPITVRATPYRYSDSYQSPFPAAAIGQEITFEDWQLSQAYQAFTLSEAFRKKRWLGYDGLIYNQLSNGGDPTALLDARGYAKLAYHAVQTTFQNTLAGSQTTDIAYLTGEPIPVFINHVGKRTRVQLKITVKNPSGIVIETRQFPYQTLAAGNTTYPIGNWISSVTEAGWYIVEYEVLR